VAGRQHAQLRLELLVQIADGDAGHGRLPVMAMHAF
jgi:hypothetical protein